MKRTLLLILTLLMLAGCSAAKPQRYSLGMTTLYNSVDDALELELPEARFNNAKKKYYSYYIPRGVGREERNATSNLFVIYGNNAILNLDVASIVQSAHEEASGDESVRNRLRSIGSFTYSTFKKDGEFTNSSGDKIQYRVMVGDFADTMSYIIVQTNHFSFSSVCPVMETDEMIYEMIKILRTCTVDEEAIINDYSYVEDQNDAYTVVTLFKEMLPESGYVVDYIEDWKNDRSFTMIDYSQADDEPENPGIEGDDVADDLSTDDSLTDNTDGSGNADSQTNGNSNGTTDAQQ